MEEKKKKLKEDDTKELVTAKSWTVSEKWKILQTRTLKYDLTSNWPIDNIKRWTNGKSEFTKEVKTDFSLSGELKGKLMRGLYVNITLEVEKRKKYEHEIKDLKEQIAKIEVIAERTKKEQNDLEAKHEGYIKTIKKFLHFIDEREAKIREFSSTTMTLEVALEWLRVLEETGVTV